VLAAQDRGFPVALGLEIDFFPETFDAVLALIDPYPWDFLIGSVHWIGGWAIDSSGALVGFNRKGLEWTWDRYFEQEVQLASTGGVDVLAHVDLPKKYGYRLPIEPLDHYAAVVAAASDSGTAVEVSSQGLRKPAAEVYPAPTLLKMFHDAGVPITLASDGHLPREAGWGHDEVVAAARAAGYTTRLRFNRRHRSEVPL
jgi:histidinol-phosphatase (PHP family)